MGPCRAVCGSTFSSDDHRTGWRRRRRRWRRRRARLAAATAALASVVVPETAAAAAGSAAARVGRHAGAISSVEGGIRTARGFESSSASAVRPHAQMSGACGAHEKGGCRLPRSRASDAPSANERFVRVSGQPLVELPGCDVWFWGFAGHSGLWSFRGGQRRRFRHRNITFY